MTQPELLDRLEADLRQLLEQLRAEIAPLADEALNFRPSQDRWTILECCAHLNVFAEMYLPRIEAAIHRAKARKWYAKPVEVRYTWMAGRDIRRVDMNNGKKKRAKKHYDFYGQPLDRVALKTHIINLERMLRYVAAARETDINRAKVGRGKSGFFNYTLGNILEWFTLHSQRHLRQMLDLQVLVRN